MDINKLAEALDIDTSISVKEIQAYRKEHECSIPLAQKILLEEKVLKEIKELVWKVKDMWKND